MPEEPPQVPEGGFLKGKYWSGGEFREAVEKTARKEATPPPQKPREQILSHLKRLKRVIEEKGELFRQISLYPRLIIQPENITDEYIKGTLLGNFAELKGYDREKLKNPEIKDQITRLFEKETGKNFETYRIPEEEREQIREQTIKDQKTSLDRWFEYLTGPEAKHYPNAFKYWAFAEMTKLGVLDRERGDFTKRTKETVAPFPELNQQALALILDELGRKHLGQPSLLRLEEAEQKEFQNRLKSENFGKLYAWVLEYVNSLKLPQERLIITEGEWKRFARGSEGQELVKSIEGYNTGWCISGLGTTQSYLARADVWIYFSQDAEGKNTIPRAAIVTGGERISEVRGIIQTRGTKQHLDDYIIPLVSEKLKELPGGEEWQQEMEDMKRLVEIHLKSFQKQSLTKEDLSFLYEIERSIQGMGYGNDPRIAEVLRGRDIRSDLSFVFKIPQEKISTNRKEALSGNILFHYGDLDLRDLTSAEGLRLPEEIDGYLDLSRLTSAKDLELPKSIGGDLYLGSLTSAEGLRLPEEIGGDLDLRSLTSAEGLELPKKIYGSLFLALLTSAKDLRLPKSIGGGLYLRDLTSAKDLELPKSIGGDLYLGSLTSAEGLRLPEEIGGDLDLRSLTSAEGLELPKKIYGSLFLRSLTLGEKAELKKQYPNLFII